MRPWPPGSHQRPDEVGAGGGRTPSHPSSRGPESLLRGCVLGEQLADPHSFPLVKKGRLCSVGHVFFSLDTFSQPVSKPSNLVRWGQWAWVVDAVSRASDFQLEEVRKREEPGLDLDVSPG